MRGFVLATTNRRQGARGARAAGATWPVAGRARSPICRRSPSPTRPARPSRPTPASRRCYYAARDSRAGRVRGLGPRGRRAAAARPACTRPATSAPTPPTRSASPTSCDRLRGRARRASAPPASSARWRSPTATACCSRPGARSRAGSRAAPAGDGGFGYDPIFFSPRAGLHPGRGRRRQGRREPPRPGLRGAGPLAATT